MPRLLLVEDHVLVRQSLRAFLEDAAYEVVGETDSGAAAIRMCQDLEPDVVIMDIHLPDMSGIDAARAIKEQLPRTHIVALTAYNETAYQRALKAIGADGFVLKTAKLEELLTVIQHVIKPSFTSEALPTSDAANTSSELTQREREVLTYAARGFSNKQIGATLGISSRTVQVHLQSIYQKLRVTNRTEAALRAIAMRLGKPSEGSVE
jgi:NarL family two-component system response regulator YdfI